MGKDNRKLVSDVSRAYLYRRCNDCAGDIIGRVLTITDAAAQDEVQRAALKDLITPAVWTVIHFLEHDIGYLCDDLATKLGETPDESGNPQEIQRVSIFE